jgi:predicted transcriptional regulator
MTLVGRARVAEVKVGTIEEVWRERGPDTGISRAEYDEYFAGAQQAVAIELIDIRRLPKPRPLNDLRLLLAGFQPPQSYRYLNKSEVATLI